jgi:hypothetical protein
MTLNGRESLNPFCPSAPRVARIFSEPGTDREAFQSAADCQARLTVETHTNLFVIELDLAHLTYLWHLNYPSLRDFVIWASLTACCGFTKEWPCT